MTEKANQSTCFQYIYHLDIDRPIHSPDTYNMRGKLPLEFFLRNNVSFSSLGCEPSLRYLSVFRLKISYNT